MWGYTPHPRQPYGCLGYMFYEFKEIWDRAFSWGFVENKINSPASR